MESRKNHGGRGRPFMKSLQGQGRGVLAIHLNRSTFFGPVDKTDEMFFSIKSTTLILFLCCSFCSFVSWSILWSFEWTITGRFLQVGKSCLFDREHLLPIPTTPLSESETISHKNWIEQKITHFSHIFLTAPLFCLPTTFQNEPQQWKANLMLRLLVFARPI